jgi:hypothetical protein
MNCVVSDVGHDVLKGERRRGSGRRAGMRRRREYAMRAREREGGGKEEKRKEKADIKRGRGQTQSVRDRLAWKQQH